MNYQWLKAKKWFRGGSHEDFILVTDGFTEEDFENAIEEWGEHSNGGHCCGYDIKWDLVNEDEVPKEVIEKKIKKLKGNIEYHKDEIVFCNDKIKLLQSLLENK